MVSFTKSYTIKLENDKNAIITDDSFFSKGGQGLIYHVTIGDKPAVLKWYHSKSAYNSTFKTNLKKLMSLKIDGFILPKYMTKTIEGEYGYVMDLISPIDEMVPLSDIIYNDSVRFNSKLARIKTPEKIAECFAKLHEKNLCFTDINDNNIFVNIKKPNVLICDCDNIAESGSETFVKGKPGFMAPEIMTKQNNPGITSDLFSIAVVLFMLILKQRPFVGKAVHDMDEESMEKAYGINPIFVMDPSNDSNRPEDESFYKNWTQLPDYITDAFIKTFTVGLKDPSQRVTASEWQQKLHKWGHEQMENPNQIHTEDIKCKKRYQPIFFIVDSSNSMVKESRMDSVNNALNKFCEEGKAINDMEIAINILQFSDDARWVYSELREIQKVGHMFLTCTGRFTHIEEAYKTLDMDLNESIFPESKKTNNPLILLFTDGYANKINYLANLSSLEKNRWFKKSYKYGIGIKTDDDNTMLLDFTRDREKITICDDETKLCDLIINITMTITQSISDVGHPPEIPINKYR